MNYLELTDCFERLATERWRSESIDAVVFDVDGVLLDVSRSYPEVIAQSVLFYLTRVAGLEPGDSMPIDPLEVQLFKAAGGFNSDWDIAKAVVILNLVKSRKSPEMNLSELRLLSPSLPEFTRLLAERGGGLRGAKETPGFVGSMDRWDESRVQRICEEFYGGEDGCEIMFGHRPRDHTGEPGLFNQDVPIVDPALLDGPIRRFGIYTTRVYRETMPALDRCGLTPLVGSLLPHQAIVTDGAPYRKPDPRGLEHIAARLDARTLVFAGDNIDDWRTVERHRNEIERARGSAHFLFAGILGGALGPAAENIFRDAGADFIARDINVLLRHLQHGER